MALVWLGIILISGYLTGLAIARSKEKGSNSLPWLWIELGVILVILAFIKFSVAYGAQGFAWLQLSPNWAGTAAGYASISKSASHSATEARYDYHRNRGKRLGSTYRPSFKFWIQIKVLNIKS